MFNKVCDSATANFAAVPVCCSQNLLCLVVDGAGPTAEQQGQLQNLMQSLKQIEEQQKELQAAIQTAKAEKEEMLKQNRDFYDPIAKDLPPPKMEVGTFLL